MDRYAGGLGDWLERPTSRRCRGLCKFRRTGEIRSGLRCRLEQGHEFGSLRLGEVAPERTPTADLSRGRGARGPCYQPGAMSNCSMRPTPKFGAGTALKSEMYSRSSGPNVIPP